MNKFSGGCGGMRRLPHLVPSKLSEILTFVVYYISQTFSEPGVTLADFGERIPRKLTDRVTLQGKG
jgi:hypothetical protein